MMPRIKQTSQVHVITSTNPSAIQLNNVRPEEEQLNSTSKLTLFCKHFLNNKKKVLASSSTSYETREKTFFTDQN